MSVASKILWIDTETTGVDFDRCDVIQYAALAEIGGQVVQEIEAKMQPREDALISPGAKKAHGYSKADLAEFPLRSEGFERFLAFLERYVSRYNKQDKFIIAGYNVGFDDQMMRAFFKHMGDKWYGSWFFWPKIDVQTYLAQWIAERGLRLPNFKLKTACEHFGIPLGDAAHDALADIQATRALYYTLRYTP